MENSILIRDHKIAKVTIFIKQPEKEVVLLKVEERQTMELELNTTVLVESEELVIRLSTMTAEIE